MNLVVHLPYAETEHHPGALSLAQRAPTFTVEWMNGERVAIAVFPSLPEGLDLAVQLVGESMGLVGAWASINAKPLSSLPRLWQRLVCYRDSLKASDPGQYCREQSMHFNALAVCAGQRGAGLCQFLAIPTVSTDQEGRIGTDNRQWETAARLAEIDWCPRLNLRSSLLPLQDPISPLSGDSIQT
jgi:hypothetical protein